MGVVGATNTEQEASAAPSQRPRRRGRWLSVAAIAVIAMVGGVALGRDDPTMAVDLVTDTSLAAVPTRSMTARWSLPLDDRFAGGGQWALLGRTVVTSQAVLDQTLPRTVAVRLVASDLVTGGELWRTEVDPATAVMLIDPASSDRERLWGATGDTGITRRVTGLSAVDGTVLWTRPQVGPLQSLGYQRGSGHVWVSDDVWTSGDDDCVAFDRLTGETTMVIAGVVGCMAFPNALIVMRTDSIEVRKLTGELVIELPGSLTVPVMVDDMIYNLEDGDLIGYDHDGHKQWRSELPWSFSWLRPIPTVGVAAIGPSVTSDLPVIMDATGQRVNLPPEIVDAIQFVAVDDRLLSVEVSPGSRRSGDAVAPILIRIRDLVDGAVITERVLDTGAQPVGSTGHGLLVANPSTTTSLTLHDWLTLDPVWTLDLGSGEVATVQTGPDGLVVAMDTAEGLVLSGWY